MLAPTAKKHTAALLGAVGLHDVLTPLLCHRGGLCQLDDVLDTAIPTLLAALGAGRWRTPQACIYAPFPHHKVRQLWGEMIQTQFRLQAL